MEFTVISFVHVIVLSVIITGHTSPAVLNGPGCTDISCLEASISNVWFILLSLSLNEQFTMRLRAGSFAKMASGSLYQAKRPIAPTRSIATTEITPERRRAIPMTNSKRFRISIVRYVMGDARAEDDNQPVRTDGSHGPPRLINLPTTSLACGQILEHGGSHLLVPSVVDLADEEALGR